MKIIELTYDEFLRCADVFTAPSKPHESLTGEVNAKLSALWDEVSAKAACQIANRRACEDPRIGWHAHLADVLNLKRIPE